MPNIEKISVALPPEMVANVRHAVETGEYASSSEVVRDALRDWTERRELREATLKELRRAWHQAQKSKAPGRPLEEVFDRLERKYQALVDASNR